MKTDPPPKSSTAATEEGVETNSRQSSVARHRVPDRLRNRAANCTAPGLGPLSLVEYPPQGG